MTKRQYGYKFDVAKARHCVRCGAKYYSLDYQVRHCDKCIEWIDYQIYLDNGAVTRTHEARDRKLGGDYISDIQEITDLDNKGGESGKIRD